MDELLKKRIEAVKEVIVGRKSICKNMEEIKPLMNELNHITMDSELSICEFGVKLLIIIKKICKELEKEKEEGDESSQIILDAFNSLYAHVYHVLQG